MTEKAAIERAFPGSAAERRTLFLTPEQVGKVEQAARSKLPSAVVPAFVARRDGVVTGRGVLATHTGRTMPESVLTVVEPDGRLRMALVLQFAEPPDYLPREGWLKTLEGRVLDDELWPGRSVRRVTGATLTVQALTEAVRPSLALDASGNPRIAYHDFGNGDLKYAAKSGATWNLETVDATGSVGRSFISDREGRMLTYRLVGVLPPRAVIPPNTSV